MSVFIKKYIYAYYILLRVSCHSKKRESGENYGRQIMFIQRVNSWFVSFEFFFIQ